MKLYLVYSHTVDHNDEYPVTYSNLEGVYNTNDLALTRKNDLIASFNISSSNAPYEYYSIDRIIVIEETILNKDITD